MRIFVFENGIENAPTEYSQHLIYPYGFERCHDESLAAASVVLKNTRREDAFAPGTFVFIGNGSYTSEGMDQWVIVSPSRVTNHTTNRYTHTLYLCEPTKMLERYVLGNKTFTRSMAKKTSYDSKLAIAVVLNSGDETEINNNDLFYYTLNLPVVSPLYTRTIRVHAFSSVFPNVSLDNTHTGAASVTVRKNGSIYRKYLYDLYEGLDYITDEDGNETAGNYGTFDDWKTAAHGIDLPSYGLIKIEYTIAESGNARNVSYNIAVIDPDAPVKGNISLLQACQIAADVAQLENEGVAASYRVRAVGEIAEREMAQEITDIDLSNATLREAINSIAGVANCSGKHRLTYNASTGKFIQNIEIHPIHSNEYADVSSLGAPVLQKMTDSIDGECSALDSQAANLINMSDGGTVSEPTDNAYISLRSETVRITEGNCIIPTAHPIYKFVGLQVQYEGDDQTYTADISHYVYEDTEYNMLSSFDPVYPNSKAYALKYKRGTQNITDLSFVQENAVSELLERASIVNICNAEFGTDFGGISFKGDGMLEYPKLSFRITYIPVINMRVRQAKPFISDHTTRNIICYNQSAQSVDSVRYGRNLAGMADRTGQAEKTLVYKCRKDAALPKAGQRFDDEYVITKIAVEVLPSYQTVQLGLSRYFNRLNPFVGIDSELRLFEISENNYIDRNVIYEDYCIISDKVHTPKQTPLITPSGLQGFLNSVIGVTASGTYLPQMAIAQGYSELEGKLNKVALPVTAFGLGRSIVFSFGYQDNYSAGDKSIHPGEYGEVYRLKEAVPYSDSFGEIDKLKVALVSKTRTGQLIPNDLPLETSGADFVELFDTGDDKRLRLYKDSRERIQVTYQINFVTDKNWIISPAFAEDMKMVTRRSAAASQAIYVYALPYRLSASDTRIDLDKAVKQVYYADSYSTANFIVQVNTDKHAIEQRPEVFGAEQDRQRFTASGLSWAVAYDDGRLLFGCNQTIQSGVTELPNINFTFTHQI